MAFGLTVATLYFGAATFALRDLSRVRLARALQRRGREAWLDTVTAKAGDLMMAAATIRLFSNIGLILVTIALFHGKIDSRLAHDVAVLLVSGAVILVFGLAVPNAWARYAGEELVVDTYYVLALCGLVLKPVVSSLEFLDEIVRRLAGAPRHDDAGEAEHIEQEILDAVSEGEKHGAVDETEKEMIESVIELRDTHVGQIMTPRTDMIALDVASGVAAARELVIKEGHSRIPLYEENIDKIVGVLYAKDLLTIERDGDTDLREIMRTVPFVPESKSLRDLLQEFQTTKIHLAVVIDEYGGTAGVVTFEDILEELVGEIVDEYEPPEPEPLTRIDEATVEVDAKLRIDELNDELDVQLPEGKDYDTVGGFVLAEMGRIPSEGEELLADNVHLRVLDADDRKINRLRVFVDRAQSVDRNGNGD